jgi:hypothetical protein
MSWEDVFKVVLGVIGSVGGGAAIVFGFSAFLGRVWADRLAQRERFTSEKEIERMRADVEGGLRRLDAALGHRSFLMQRFAEMELEGLRECWTKARACLPAINGPRAVNSGTNLDDLKQRVEQLRIAHDEVMEALGKHEPFLTERLVDLLEQVRQKANLELLQIGSREPFNAGDNRGGDDWWDQGRKNQVAVKDLTDELKAVVKARIAELMAEKA